MFTAAIALGGIGLLAAVGLGVAAKLFFVESDPVVAEVEEALPGANCGGCGFAGCSAAAEAMASGKLPPSGCVGGGPDVAVVVAGILGLSVSETEPQIAQVGCRYPLDKSDRKFDYSGIEDCRAAYLLSGGPKECPVGCIGLGSCAAACPFGALTIGPNGLPEVNENLCTGCGTCERTCPVGIMKLTSVSDRILNEYSFDQCTAPCQRTCPAGIDVPAYVKAAGQGDYAKALLTIKERNPLPLVCGRICPHPCEAACRRNLTDEPVAINPIKRFVSDWEMESNQRLQPYKAPATGKRAVIVGGGPQGLTAAWFLARLGHSPFLFEAQPKLGGLLRQVIPESRLPRNVLDYEIEGILEMGVEARTGVVIGQDFTLADLMPPEYDAVFLATGGWDTAMGLGASGRSDSAKTGLPGVYLMLPLLLGWRKGDGVKLRGKTVIVGGGKAAAEAAAKALNAGAGEVIILDRKPASRSLLNPEDLPEGCTLVQGARVTELQGQQNQIISLSYVADGQTAMVGGPDSIIVAAARLPEMLIAPQNPAAANHSAPIIWLARRPYGRPGDERLGLFDSAANASDHRSTVEAIGLGRQAAASIHQVLTGGPVDRPSLMLDPALPVLTVNEVCNLADCSPRSRTATAAPDERWNPKVETDQGLTEDQVKTEADRCLNCGLLCYHRTEYN